MFTVLGTGVLMAAPISRNAILDFIFDVRYDHTIIEFGATPDLPDADMNITFRYAPEGFELSTYSVADDVITYVFQNNYGKIILMNRSRGASLRMGIDNEYAHFSEIQLQGGEAFIFEAINESELSTIMWLSGEYVFTITANIEIEALIDLAEIYMKN